MSPDRTNAEILVAPVPDVVRFRSTCLARNLAVESPIWNICAYSTSMVEAAAVEGRPLFVIRCPPRFKTENETVLRKCAGTRAVPTQLLGGSVVE